MKIMLATALSGERFNSIPDIGLGLLAAMARDAGHEALLIDSSLEDLDAEAFAARVRDEQPDIVGIKAYSCDILYVERMLDAVAEAAPDTVRIIGGPHPSTEIPERLFRMFPALTAAFAGEAEPGFGPFLAKVEAGQRDYSDVPGLVWRDEAGEVHANTRTVVEDLDGLPLPAWDLLQPRRYTAGYSFMTNRLPAAPLVLTRGCPFHCTFCGSYLITGRRVRKRSLDGVLEEVRLLVREHGVRTIDVVDENCAFDRDYLAEFCRRLIAEDFDLNWNCPYGVRLNSLDEELVGLMDRAGCTGMSVGVESGCDRVLERVKKCLTVAQVREQVTMIKRVSSIMIQGYFMIGFPDETREEIEQTIDLACSLPFDIVTFCPLRVTPGTEIYERLVAEGRIPPDVDYAGMGHHYFVRSYSQVSDAEMKKLYRKAYLKFYFRPKVAWNLLRRMATAAQMRTILNGLWRLTYNPKPKPSTSSGA